MSEETQYCFKCKKAVEKEDWNAYYHICNKCVEQSTGH